MYVSGRRCNRDGLSGASVDQLGRHGVSIRQPLVDLAREQEHGDRTGNESTGESANDGSTKDGGDGTGSDELTKARHGSPDAQARVIEGLITGIGFIGGGAILKHGGSVRGTATAASIWVTGAIGASVAYAYYEIAVALSLVTFATLRVVTPLKGTLDIADRQRDDDTA